MTILEEFDDLAALDQAGRQPAHWRQMLDMVTRAWRWLTRPPWVIAWGNASFYFGPDYVRAPLYGPRPWKISLVWDLIPLEEREQGRLIYRHCMDLHWTWRPDITTESLIRPAPTITGHGWPDPNDFNSAMWTGRRRRFIWWRWDFNGRKW